MDVEYSEKNELKFKERMTYNKIFTTKNTGNPIFSAFAKDSMTSDKPFSY